jgi:hypothetical protein
MDSSNLAIRIIPDLTIDDKYSAIVDDALKRIASFSEKALSNRRLGELFDLERSRLSPPQAEKVVRADGRLVVGFQFETRADAADITFGVFVRKIVGEKKNFKLYLHPTVQEILLQLISLEDRRTVAVFSMLSSSLDVGYKILTNLYGNQLRRLQEKAPDFVTPTIQTKLERLKVARASDEGDLWNDSPGAHKESAPGAGVGRPSRPGSQDNILQVMADEGTAAEINQYVENVLSRTERIRDKRRKIEENPDMDRDQIYELMVREDLDQLENCYAGIHIYLRAFYKNKDRRHPQRNRILRQFFASEIEKISADTGLLEDLLSLSQDEYFKNIARHKELQP